jgi:hypothetical protein
MKENRMISTRLLLILSGFIILYITIAFSKIMEEINISDGSIFQQKLLEAENLSKATGRPLYMLFSGPEWCGDSKRGEPVVRKKLEELTEGCILLYAAASRAEYKSSSYFYKSPPTDVRCVPTLIRWKDGKAHSRLNDDECQSETIVEDFLKRK